MPLNLRDQGKYILKFKEEIGTELRIFFPQLVEDKAQVSIFFFLFLGGYYYISLVFSKILLECWLELQAMQATAWISHCSEVVG